jgi:transglutaminase-like putative cysteine protease
MTSVTLSVEHDTRYTYSAPVEVAQHLAYLQPLEDTHQHVDWFEMHIDPAPSRHTRSGDVFGNHRAYFTVTTRHRALHVRARSRIVVRPRVDSLRLRSSPAWEVVREGLRYRAGAPFDPASEFLSPSPYVPRLAALADYGRASFGPGRPLAEAALELMHRTHADFAYSSRSTDVNTPLAEAFAQRRGVCQDFAHVMIAALRGIGLAASYTSGYLLTEPPPGQPRLQGADASHAWVSVYCPGSDLAGDWLDLDPTNDLVPGAFHVRLALGRDYGDVTPLRGVIRGGGEHHLDVRVHTDRIG